MHSCDNASYEAKVQETGVFDRFKSAVKAFLPQGQAHNDATTVSNHTVVGGKAIADRMSCIVASQLRLFDCQV